MNQRFVKLPDGFVLRFKEITWKLKGISDKRFSGILQCFKILGHCYFNQFKEVKRDGNNKKKNIYIYKNKYKNKREEKREGRRRRRKTRPFSKEKLVAGWLRVGCGLSRGANAARNPLPTRSQPARNPLLTRRPFPNHSTISSSRRLFFIIFRSFNIIIIIISIDYGIIFSSSSSSSHSLSLSSFLSWTHYSISIH